MSDVVPEKLQPQLPLVLMVDDEPENLALLEIMLGQDYSLRAATSGSEALKAVNIEPLPDLILLDIMMPGMSGFEVLEQLKADIKTADIPVIFLTALDSIADEERGLDLGAADYVTKPIRPSVLSARVKTQLLAKKSRDWLMARKEALDSEVLARMSENDLIQQVAIRALAHLAEARDPETGNHILRTQNYIHLLALQLKDTADFSKELTAEAVEMITKSAPLHDIGKVGIPDRILRKPGPLNDEEWHVMKTHTILGAEAIERAEKDVDMEVSFLRYARDIARWHHEYWDGQGYPDGLRGTDIPVSARLMAIADVFDALVTKRVYKRAFSFDEAYQIILQGRGKQFDPLVVDAFVELFDQFKHIAKRFSDNE